MSTVTQHGYLVFADISGYTSFVAKTELEHSHEILTELLELLVERFKPLLTISKLEGDAVFAYVDEDKLARGETLLEFMEITYAAFRDKQISMRRKTTCTCLACQNIPSLDLKFIAHHGDYIVQRVKDIHELVGSDVNLIHRLSKNHITESTGWRAYMMLTERCLNHLKMGLEEAHVQVETYEHLGDVRTFTLDLHQRYAEIVDERRVWITDKEADLILRVHFPVPQHVAWEWMQDPVKRNIWCPEVTWSIGDRPGGRMRKGGSNHCAHGKGMSTEVTLDWRPFNYSTIDSFHGEKKLFTDTAYFEPQPDGTTQYRDCIRMYLVSNPRFVRRIVAWFVFVVVNKLDKLLLNAARLAEEDHKKTQPAP